SKVHRGEAQSAWRLSRPLSGFVGADPLALRRVASMLAAEFSHLILPSRNFWHFRANRSIHHSMHNCVAWHGPYSLRQATPLRDRQAPSFCPSIMHRLLRMLLSVLIAVPIPLVGCRQQRPPAGAPYDNSAMGVALTRIEYPDVEVPSRDTIFPLEPPRTLRNLSDFKYWA